MGSENIHFSSNVNPLLMQTWRMRERMKTVSVALVICLNVGVDPPDVTKTDPCARQVLEPCVKLNLQQYDASFLESHSAFQARMLG